MFTKKIFEWKPLSCFAGIFLFLAVAIFFTGCVHVPTEMEMIEAREAQAKKDLEMINPSADLMIDFEEPLTLEQVIKIGLKNNLELRVQNFRRMVADKETLAAKLKMLPGLDVGASWNYRDKLRKSDVYDWEEDRDKRDTTVSELKDSLRGDLSLTFDVLDLALAYVQSDEKELQEQVLERQRTRQEQELALEITEAYWRAAAVEDALDYVHKVEKKLTDIKKKIDASVRDEILDRMAATDIEMRLKELELTIRQLQANLSSSRLKLSQLMGLNQNIQYTLYRPPIKPIVAQLPHTKELDIDRLEEFALLHRPELFESDIKVLIQKAERKRAFLSLFPGFNLFAATHYDDNRLLLSNTWNSWGASLGWQLLDLPSRIASLGGYEKAEEMANEQRLMMTVGVITQVHIALLDYSIKVDRFRLLDETYNLASDLLNLARDKRAAGKLRDVDVTQRYLEEMAAKLRRDEAVVDLLTAHKRLCVAIGINPLDCGKNLLQPGSGELEAAAQPPQRSIEMKKWKCTECGYVHTGPHPPEICPVCGADSSKFIEIPFEEGPDEEPVVREEDLTSGVGESREYNLNRGTATPGFAGDASERFLWKVQLGAFTNRENLDRRLQQIRDLDLRLLDNRDTQITTKRIFDRLFNRIRIIGMTEKEAKKLVGDLQRNGMEYWLLPPGSTHWD